MEIPQSKTVVIVASLVLLGAGVSLWRMLRPPAVNTAPFIGVGQVLAEEVAKAVNNGGRVVAAVPEANAGTPTWEAFSRELKKHNAITLAATESVAHDPEDPQPDMDGCPINAFTGILKRHGQADAIVFFMGIPAWSWLQERNSLPPAITGTIIVLASTTSGLKRHYEPYFKNEIIAALIVRGGAGTGQIAKPKTPREWFDNEYQIFTPQSYESLPE